MITTTLEQSQKLKELRAPQSTELYWYESAINLWAVGTLTDVMNFAIADRNSTSMASINPHVSAYTLEELIEWLPKEIDSYIFALAPVNDLKDWGAMYLDNDGFEEHFAEAKTLLEAVYNLAIAVKGEK